MDEHNISYCPKCGQKLRVPFGLGALDITCCNCEHTFSWISESEDSIGQAELPQTEDPQKLIEKALQAMRIKLLDLSKRNRLLNFKPRKPFKIVNDQVKRVFDFLVTNDNSMTFVAAPESPREDEKEATENDTVHERKENTLQTEFSEEELERRLRRIHSNYNKRIDETGRNQLLLAIGFLYWKEQSDAEQYKAPLIMIPVELKRVRSRTGWYNYTLKYSGEDLVSNRTLLEKAKGLGPELPPLVNQDTDDGLNEEEDLNPEAYLAAVKEKVSHVSGWEVKEDIFLDFFTFSKQLMYDDLDPQAWPGKSICKHNIITKLLGLDSELPGTDLPNEINEPAAIKNLSLVMDADSFQSKAILKAMSGQSMVIQGPPGTGKSQTITNLIACFLDAGKSVLFVAQKMPALDVVHNNLERVGLLDFCLELHSHKVKKIEVRDSMERVLERRKELQSKDVRHIDSKKQRQRLIDTRNSLGEYVELLKKPVGPNEETIYEIFGKVEQLRARLKNPSSLSIDNVDSITDREIQDGKNLLDELERSIQELGIPHQNIWYGYEPVKLVSGDDHTLAENLNAAREAVGRVVDKLKILTAQTAHEISPSALKYRDLQTMSKLEPESIPSNIVQNLLGTFLLSHNEKPWEAFRFLKSSIGEYNGKVAQSSELLENPEKISPTELNTAHKLLTKICNRGLHSLTLRAANDIGVSCQRVAALLQEFSTIIRSHIAAGFAKPKTIAGIRKFVELDSLIREKPLGLETDLIEKLFTNSFKILFTEVIEKGSSLSKRRDYLEKIFALRDVCSIDEITEIRRVLRLTQGKFFKFVTPPHKEAKRILLTFLRDRSKAKSPTIANDLETLENFIVEEVSFANDQKYRQTFGDLFKGVDTDWNNLRQVVLWATDLSHAAGSVGLAKELAKLSTEVQDNWPNDGEINRIHVSMNQELESYIDAVEDTAYAKQSDEIEDKPIKTLAREFTDLGNTLTSIWTLLASFILREDSTLSEVGKAVEAQVVANKIRKKVEDNQQARSILGPNFKGVDTDVDRLNPTIDWTWTIRQLGLPCELLEQISTVNVCDFITLLRNHSEQWKDDLELVKAKVRSLGQYGDVDDIIFWGTSIDESVLSKLDERLGQLISNIDHLTSWADYCRCANKGKDIGLGEIIGLVEGGKLPPAEAADTYLYAVYNSFAKKVLQEHLMLSTFTRAEYESKRRQFADLDREVLGLSQQEVAFLACQEEPPLGKGGYPVKNRTDMRLLEGEIKKKRRHLTIRHLMERAGNAIKALKPVFMMSPMSVAQFLKPGKHTFDVVIMDEASQIEPHDALGAIARGKQLIVVGDSKQLPPTTFFQTQMDNPDGEEDGEVFYDDLESILDWCEDAKFHPSPLNWHYRSEHESLIAFSNAQWYGGKLIIFPSSVSSSTELGVRFNYIEGATYKKGIRVNEVEANHVAQKIIEHARKSPELSLGVGTFNLTQSDLIEDCLAKLIREDPSADLAITKLMKAHDGYEPLFIKNLESLQGNQRDVIFISCTYGPDKETGRVDQFFGPINKPKGWRRLNVLFTRAKKRMELFSSMKPEDVTAEPGQEGRVALRRFLKYAQTGELPGFSKKTGRGYESDFEAAVGQMLKNQGYEIETQVGVGRYRIDIGVCHPTRPDEYILGIECDGATYHSSKWARDRDRLREEVLTRRGWRIYRIWSTSWFKNRNQEIERLSQRLRSLVEEDKHVVREAQEPTEI